MGACTSKPSLVTSSVALDGLVEMRSRFRIESNLIGKGHYGRVFKGHSPDGNTVALKLVGLRKLSKKEKE